MLTLLFTFEMDNNKNNNDNVNKKNNIIIKQIWISLTDNCVIIKLQCLI